MSSYVLDRPADTRLHRLVRGREADPAWERPLLWLTALLAGTLVFWGLTRNGYANTYYAQAAQAASRSWKAWLTNALDTSGSVSLDKGPLPNMMMGLSGRLFGFSSFSMLLPEALCGVGAVLVLHNTVKRTLGHRAAIVAALMLALTPIFVAMSRFDNPDALLVLLEVAAAWALVRALQSGCTRHVLLCGAFVGLAFNVKMLQAYLIVPGLVAALLLAGQGSFTRRAAHLLAGGVSMLAVSFAWYGTMMLLPAADRPWVGDTTDDSWFSLIFGANGLSRVSGSGAGTTLGAGALHGAALGTGAGPGGGAALGPGPAGAGAGGGGMFGGAAGPLRLFNSIVGGQIAWLLPLALVGLVLGLWASRGAPRTDLKRSAYILWGLWGAVSWAVFSFSAGIFHPYYTTALAPAVAVLAGGGVVALWDRARASLAWTVALAVVLLGTAALAVVLLDRASGFATFVAPAVLTLAVLAVGALLSAKLGRPASAGRRRLLWFAALAGLAAMLAGPGAYSIATVGERLSGGNPLAGPASAETGAAGAPGGGFAGARPSGTRPPAAQGQGAPAAGTPPVAATGGGPPMLFAGGPGALTGGRAGSAVGAASAAAAGAPVSRSLVSYLEAHQGKAEYLVAAVGSSTSAAIALQSGREVINMGGFMGSDPAPSLAKLRSFIASGRLHYVLLGGQAPGGVGGSVAGPGGRSSASSARDAWIAAHGTVVHIARQGSSEGGMTLYYFRG